MALSKTAKTHLIYQFIILTLLFLGISYNEFFPERKLVFLALIPMFLYQLLILSCCSELISLPDWMNAIIHNFSTEESLKEIPQSPTAAFEKTDFTVNNEGNASVVKRLCVRNWIEAVPNPEPTEPQMTKTSSSKNKRAKSWVNLREPASNVFTKKEEILRKGSMENLTAFAKQDKLNKTADVTSSLRVSSNFRRDTTLRSRSWKIKKANQEVEKQHSQPVNPPTYNEIGIPNGVRSKTSGIQNEESELTKSYSFPFRQKRLEKWIELKENKAEDPLKNSPFPYWKTEGYNLAVKYEARRRRRADSGPAATADDEARTTITYEPLTKQPKYSQISEESMNTNKMCAKRNSGKQNLAYLNKVKMGFSQLISKSKKPENRLQNQNKEQVKSDKDPEDSYLATEAKNTSVPKLPKFLSIDRPVLLYPKYIPFEKDRFEKDVKKKMIELGEEQTSC